MVALTSSRNESASSPITLDFSIKNSVGRPIRNASLAWLDYDRHPQWGDPIEFERVIAPGRTVKLDVSARKLRVVEFKVKFFIDGQRNLVEVGLTPTEPGPWYHWTSIELTVDQWGYFLSWQSWDRIEFRAE